MGNDDSIPHDGAREIIDGTTQAGTSPSIAPAQGADVHTDNEMDPATRTLGSQTSPAQKATTAPGLFSQATPDQSLHDNAPLTQANDIPVRKEAKADNLQHLRPVKTNIESTSKRHSRISDLYDEIEPEYRRLLGGNLDLGSTNFDTRMDQWQELKYPDARVESSSVADHLENLEVSENPASFGGNTEGTRTDPASSTSQHGTLSRDGKEMLTVQQSNGHQNDDFVSPEVVVATARRNQSQGSQDHGDQVKSLDHNTDNRTQNLDDRPDAAKMEDLKRFAYAHGTVGARSKKSQRSEKTAPGKQEHHVPANTSRPEPDVSSGITQDTGDVPGPASGENLSWHRKSKVSKLLGLKPDSAVPQENIRTSGSIHESPLTHTENDAEADSDSDADSIDSLPTNNNQASTSAKVRRQVSFKRAAASQESIFQADKTARRALLIKAAHLEVCNHVTSSANHQIKQSHHAAKVSKDGWCLIGLAGLSFWDRLTEMEKLKSQMTIIDIMRRYNYEARFGDDSLDQLSARDGGLSVSHDTAVTLDPKSDLPLSTDIDNEVGRSRAAAEFIIEKLSDRLSSGHFRDEEENVFRVPVKGHGPLGRIRGDAEWRMVQEAVSAHALGRGYQVQMGDGPEEITKPWQVRQKDEIKDALVSFTKWPSASELIWVKVNRLGIDN